MVPTSTQNSFETVLKRFCATNDLNPEKLLRFGEVNVVYKNDYANSIQKLGNGTLLLFADGQLCFYNFNTSKSRHFIIYATNIQLETIVTRDQEFRSLSPIAFF